ncbi:MAG: hypothetical protein ACI9GO_000698 [Bacteroidia bacterium]|jgi:hypothetical protein
MVVLVSLGQDQSYLSTSYTPGFTLAHRADIKNLAAHNYGLEVSFEKEKSESDWGAHYASPIVGYGLLYYNFGREETGHALGGMVHVKLNVLSLKKSDLKFRMGAGLAYLTEKFDVYDNRRNQAIGSHLNGSMQFGLVYHRALWRKDYIEAGISISHYSNAAFKVPNLGYNIPSFTLRYGLGVGNADTVTIHKNSFSKHTDWRGTLIYGKKQRNFADPKDFYNFGVQVRGIRHVSPVRAWRYGIDYTLDKTYKYAEDDQYPMDSVTLEDQSEIAVAVGFQWNFGKVDVVAEMGAYIYKPTVLKNALSQRMGLVYNFNDHVAAQGTLRFHRGVADFFEIGLGYTL